MSLPRYPAYKDSGVEWLGEVPAHWEVKRLRFLVQCLDGQRVPLNGAQRADRPGEVPYWGANAIMDYVDAALFDEELVLLGEDGAPFFDPTRPVAFHSTGPVWPNNHIHVLRPLQAGSGRFVAYCLNATDYAEYIDGSTRDKLTQGRMADIPVPWPAQAERDAVYTFLDRETAKIDALVAEQERLIELLKEKRQAVISHAVTKGLDPDVPMKDSGVEWLGEVPAHWQILKGAWIGTLFGSAQVPENLVTNDGEIPFIKVGSMSAETFEIESWDWYVDSSISHQCAPRTNYIAFPKRGAAIFMNKVNIVDRPSVIDPNVMGWEIGSAAIARFIAYALKSRRLDELADVSTVPQINNKHIGPERFPVPPIEEQRSMVAYLDERTAIIDALLTEAQHAISLLQERRTALISAAVTGQIDVRVT